MSEPTQPGKNPAQRQRTRSDRIHSPRLVRLLGSNARLSANDEAPGLSEADKRLAAMFAGLDSTFLDLPQALREGGAL